MEIRNIHRIEAFAAKHANARKPLQYWVIATERALWTSFDDIRRTFRSADYVDPYVVFNIGGNNFRLVAVVTFDENKGVNVQKVMTHSEYDRWKP